MLVRWEGETPPDKTAWTDVLRGALGEAAGSYWVRFYRQPEGWRFDLERRQASASDPFGSSFTPADERITLRVYTLLVESGKPLDPGWRPFAPTPPAAIVPTPAPAVAPVAPPVVATAPEPLGEAPPPAAEGELSARRGRRRRHRHRSPAPAQPSSETKAEPVDAPLAAPSPELEPPPEPLPDPGPPGWQGSPPAPEPVREEPEHPSEGQPPAAPRPPRRRGLGPALVYVPAFLLVAFAAWLSLDRFRPRAAPLPAPSPSPTVSQEVVAAQKRLAELEAVVAQLKQERAQVVPGRRPPAPAPSGTRQRTSVRQAPTPAPTPTPETAPAPALEANDVPLPAAPVPAALVPAAPVPAAPVPAAPVPAAGAEPPPTPAPVQRGALVEANDPGLTRPVLVTQTRPRYPPLALERRISGTVSLNALVDETGAVAEVSLVRASPRGLGFEDAATRYVRTRVYRPATKQGVPVRVWLPIVVEFQHPGR